MRIIQNKELTKEQVKELPKGTNYGIYNPLTDTYKFEVRGKNDIVENKHVYNGLIYYEVDIQEVKDENLQTMEKEDN